MDDKRLRESLGRLGIPDDPAELYVALLERSPEPVAVLAERLGWDRDGVRAAYDLLVDLGLASPVGRDGELACLVTPAGALDVLAEQRAGELERDRIAIAGAFEAFRRQYLSAYTDDLVEVVTGGDIVPRIARDLQGARQQIRRLDSPPYFFPGAVNAAEELALLSRGVAHRTVYASASLQDPGYLVNNIEPCIKAGEQARVLPSLPVKLVIVDDSYAHLSLSIAEADVNSSLLVVRPCGLLSALIALFETYWQTALPFYGGGRAPQRLSLSERRILALLVAGLSDDRIAAELKISRRTYFRRLESLMAQLGATSRFHLGLQAQRRGLI